VPGRAATKRTEDDKYEELLATVRDIAAATAILAHQPWGGGGTSESKLSDQMQAVAKAIGDVGRSNRLGEMSITFPDRKRARVGTQHAVTDVVADEIASAVSNTVLHEIEISYYPISSVEIRQLQSWLAMREHDTAPPPEN
jgi:hypothetical protein